MEQAPVTRFVLLFEGRTGSSFVISSLNSHPDITARGEILVKQSEEAQERYIRKLFEASPTPITGFKTKLRDIANPEAFIELLLEYDVRTIYLNRQNMIKLALSRLNAIRTFNHYGTWNLVDGMEPLPPFAPTVEEFDAALQFREEKEQKLQYFLARLVDVPLLQLSYEALLDDQERFLGDICTYLGCEPVAFTSPVRKNTADNMRDVLLNYEELKAYYAQGAYREMWD